MSFNKDDIIEAFILIAENISQSKDNRFTLLNICNQYQVEINVDRVVDNTLSFNLPFAFYSKVTAKTEMDFVSNLFLVDIDTGAEEHIGEGRIRLARTDDRVLFLTNESQGKGGFTINWIAPQGANLLTEDFVIRKSLRLKVDGQLLCETPLNLLLQFKEPTNDGNLQRVQGNG